MKSVIVFMSAIWMFSSLTQATVMTLNCLTEKGTELNLTYDNWSTATNKPELFSLKIAGKDFTSEAMQSFGTTGGRSNFNLRNFPKPNMTTHFNIYTTGAYTVSGQDYAIKCSIVIPEIKKVDNSF